MNLLIVDDHAALRQTIRLLVEQPGDHVLECETAEAALAALHTFAADWATIDFRLPGMSGLALARAIKLRYASVRCALVSSYEIDSLRELARDAGVEGYVQKDKLEELNRLMQGSREKRS